MSVGDNILKACKARGVSLARACTLADLRYSTLHSQIANEREIPFSTIDKLSAALNLPLGYFSSHEPAVRIEPDEEATLLQARAARALSNLLERQVAALADWGYQIGVEDVLDWLIAHDSMLIKHDWLIERVDLFYPVKKGDTMLRPYRIGSQSLAARYFRLLDTDDYNEVVGRFNRDFLNRLLVAHRDVANKRYSVADVMIDEVIDGARIKGTYRRLLAPVTTPDGQKLTLLFSKLAQFSTR
ncbi:helix-turn-helix domain-containing protein [Marimonas arenosa]|uniref:Helix-turn-helix domain-containing protein n=1 Tax=Marimonas arenosa TaxID=1795305 RepID=A0AAE3WCP8_9RHOB|nr:helix-turn-helix transcriptional regulator [Marimonas arenosa]MDQ2090536.1 helix-turn-helix domain-containing protein [Marimonas arenosa]